MKSAQRETRYYALRDSCADSRAAYGRPAQQPRPETHTLLQGLRSAATLGPPTGGPLNSSRSESGALLPGVTAPTLGPPTGGPSFVAGGRSMTKRAVSARLSLQ